MLLKRQNENFTSSFNILYFLSLGESLLRLSPKKIDTGSSEIVNQLGCSIYLKTFERNPNVKDVFFLKRIYLVYMRIGPSLPCLRRNLCQKKA